MFLFSFLKGKSSESFAGNVRSALVIPNRKKPFILSAGALAFLLAPILVSAARNNQTTAPSASSQSAQTLQAEMSGSSAESQNTAAPAQSDNSVTITNDGSGSEVKINGQTVPIPEDGTIDQTITNSSGSETSVHVEVNNQSSQNSESDGSTEMRSESSSRIRLRSD